MGLFDSLASNMLGKLGGEKGAIAQVAIDLFNQNGGLAGVLQKFRTAGFDDEVASWISKGSNLPIDAQQIVQALGSHTIQQAASKLNMNAQDISAKIAEYLPQVIDRMTPDGQLPREPINVLAALMSMMK
ncbi:MAG: YidB family protein [Methylotenera sp.]